MKKVGKILADRFKDAEIELEPLSSGTKIMGTLVWKGFSRYDQLERQQLLADLFEKLLTRDERRNISLIITMTPHEAMVVKE